MPTWVPVSRESRGVTSAGWVGIALMITSLIFFVFAAIETVHGHAPVASTNLEIAVFLLIAGGLLLWRAHLSVERAVRLASSGTSTVGVVTGMAKTWYQGWGEDGPPLYALRFSYQDQRGRAHCGKAICPQTDAFQWRAGDRGLVRYDLQHPGRSVWIGQGLQDNAAREARLQPASGRRVPYPVLGEIAQPSLGRLAARSSDVRSAVLPVFLGILLGLLALVLRSNPNTSAFGEISLVVLSLAYLLSGAAGIARGGRQVRSWSRLLRDGALAEATVTAVGEQARFFYRPMPNAIMMSSWTIEYRYPDGSGRSRRGTSDATPGEAVELRPGDTVAIKYDRDAPAHGRPEEASVWIGKLADRPYVFFAEDAMLHSIRSVDVEGDST